MSKRCSAKNRSGKRCGAWAVTGATKCALHADPERATELGSKRGRRVKFQSRPDMLDLPDRPLKSIDEVCELLEETINLVRRGSLDVRAANSNGLLAGIHLKALAQRVESPEATNSEASPGIYTSLFQRLGLPAAPQQRVFDLFPQPAQKDAGIASGPLPAPGEFIDDTPTRPNKLNAHLFGEERVDVGFEDQWIDNSSWLIAIRPSRSTRTSEAFLSNGMDQQEADDKHHRAGYAMN
jgi:hypothetical protein